jgi:PiT family inorganic phosphate transporter
MSTFQLTLLIIFAALIFDFLNGFHDSANSIATVVSTRVLSPGVAVGWAAFFNFVSAFTFGTAVAGTIGKGFVRLELVTPYVMLAGIVGAIAWDIITWWFGLPTSSSHALIGGYAGAAMARSAFNNGIGSSLHALTLGEWPPTLLFIVLAPMIGLVTAFVLMVAVYWVFRRFSRHQMDVHFRRLQILSAAALSFSHGTNDAQKTMGLITGTLVTAGYLKTFHVPIWVVFAAHTAIALGTASGGWRIVHTMGRKLTPLKPRSGFCAETGAACAIMLATKLGLPVSTTHCLVGSIAGVGAVQRVKAVRWGVARRIVWAWILTMPAAAAVAWAVFAAIRVFNPNA